MIRDLVYPEDARKVVASLHSGLQYDAAIAVLGQICSKTPVVGDTPVFSTGFKYGGIEADGAVRRDSEGLLSRFSFISSVSRFETHARLLLLQRRVLEELGSSGRKMRPELMWNILRRVNREMRDGPVVVCSQLLIVHPSVELQARMKWLEGIYKVRNCLAHRLGKVEMIDVKAPAAPLDSVKDSDTLKTVWLRLKATADGQDIVNFPHEVMGPGEMSINFAEYEREWKIGEQIEITALECQFVAMSLSFLGNQVLADFEREMNAIVTSAPPSPQPGVKSVVEKEKRDSTTAKTHVLDNDKSVSESPHSSKNSPEQSPHFADFEFKEGASHGERLPGGHQWWCNASLPSWPDILARGLWHYSPYVYLCERHAIELGLHW